MYFKFRVLAGMCKSASAEHGRELPLMNGIKEYIKSIAVMDSGICSEELFSLASRFKSLQVTGQYLTLCFFVVMKLTSCCCLNR